ncbi:DUF1015 family protein [Muricomes sp. OA1]|uniref:DUF1015 domain-containing protein n=1 Tax=Hungatella hathewayi TaxID=154046 RepID=A0A3E2X272_9FIRM|nr:MULTISPECIES: DUF1015 family protein [Clostridia]MCH1971574.1 DUF1015 family protein [Muricomes sp. OA1]RGC35603.1 DUF1015 domain-containing protein [Hungatella hathewayi]GKH34876.1 hypothetical protein CE91St64_42830 [Faecalicatena contorta]
MAVIRPFQGVRPAKELASSIAALPYDVYDREEAREVVDKNPLSFLKIDRAETQFTPDTDMYSQPVYDRARDTLEEMIQDGSFVRDEDPCYYIYALTMNGRTQTGLVGCASIDDYMENRIKKHENTREDKELDRTRHVDTLSAQTGPIFLAYHARPELDTMIAAVKLTAPLYDFTSEDSVRHQVWKISSTEDITQIAHIFEGIDNIYIADGHHRAASAVKAGLKRRKEHPGFSGEEEFNYFLSVLFPAEELHIYDYNRVVADLNGYAFDDFLDLLRSGFDITDMGHEVCRPACKGEIGLYGNGRWYRLTANPHLFSEDPVNRLDVSVLQNVVLGPLLNIRDPKTDSRIRFVGGIRGLDVLAEAVDKAGDGAAFAMYPTSMEELLAVADAGLLMPPKSTWFEPKLRSGFFIHQFER